MKTVDRHLWQRFWLLATPYWRSDDKWKAWGLLGLLVILLLAQTRFAVRFIEQTGEFTSALAARNEERFWDAIRLYLILLIAAVPVYALYYFARTRGLHLAAGRRHRIGGGDPGEEIVGGQSVQILHHAVVVHDLHLVMGEDHGEEIVAGLFQLRLAARRRDARGGGGAVVAVGDVEVGHGADHRADARDGRFVVDQPDSVLDAVIGGQVGNRRAGGGIGDQFFGLVAVRVGEQDRAGLRVECLNLADAVVFLVRAGEFVLADAIGVVVGD